MRRSILRSTLIALLAAGGLLAQTQNVVFTFDEFGHGRGVNTSTGISVNITGSLIGDPGPGGLAAALTYSLANPPSLVAGDLVLLEPGSAAISDVIRFNPAVTGTPYPSSLVFYSDTADGAEALADTGFPTSFYTNILRVFEVGPEGANGFTYTPTSGQPGFVAGFTVTYNILSDVPEPGSAALILGGAALMYVGRRWRKRRLA